MRVKSNPHKLLLLLTIFHRCSALSFVLTNVTLGKALTSFLPNASIIVWNCAFVNDASSFVSRKKICIQVISAAQLFTKLSMKVSS